MAIPINRPNQENMAYARTTSIGATPVAGSTVAPKKGQLQRVFAFSEGASTGTIAVAVAVAGTTITGAAMSFTGGANLSTSTEVSGTVMVNEGDLITFTPSGGGGATIPGHFYAIIR
jgi:hypothetical protein